MNHSSIFSFDETPIWDPNVIRQHLCISEEHLNIVNATPGWSKAQTNTLRLDQDSLIGNSYPQNSVSTENKQTIINQNIELFDKRLDERRNILTTYKVYREKITRCVSLIDIDKVSEKLVGCSLKRTVSLPTLFLDDFSPERHPSSDLNRKELFACKPAEYPVISNKNTALAFEFKNCEDLFSSKKANLKIMEIIAELPVNIPIPEFAGNESKLKVAAVEKNNVTSVPHITVGSNNSDNQPVASVLSESLHKHNPIINESCKLVESQIPAPCEVNKSDSNIKEANVDVCSSTHNENVANLNSENVHVTSMCENNSDLSLIKVLVPVNADSAAVSEKVEVISSVQKLNEVCELIKHQSDPLKEQSLAEENSISCSSPPSGSSCNVDVKTDNTGSAHKVDNMKRKSESMKNKRIKRRKTGEKQHYLKIRSIKKVGEVHYCVEDVKTMIDIMEQFL